MDETDGIEEKKWTIFSKKFPKNKVIYFTQIVLVYAVALTALINLSLNRDNQSLWSSLLSACIGYLLPAPQLVDDSDEDEPLLRNPSQQ